LYLASGNPAAEWSRLSVCPLLHASAADAFLRINTLFNLQTRAELINAEQQLSFFLSFSLSFFVFSFSFLYMHFARVVE
jgi:hypothetical protein